MRCMNVIILLTFISFIESMRLPRFEVRLGEPLKDAVDMGIDVLKVINNGAKDTIKAAVDDAPGPFVKSLIALSGMAVDATNRGTDQALEVVRNGAKMGLSLVP